MVIFRRPNFYLIFLLIMVGSYFLISLVRSSDTEIPAQFESSRLEGALIAQEIVELSNQSAEDIRAINDLDREGNFPGALTLVTQVIDQSQEIRARAVELSTELQGMTLALSGIESIQAREAAFESISNQLVLIGRLVNYSNYLGELLTVLRKRFNGDFSDGERVPILVANINAEVNEINKLNDKARAAIERFDELVK